MYIELKIKRRLNELVLSRFKLRKFEAIPALHHNLDANKRRNEQVHRCLDYVSEYYSFMELIRDVAH
jgi:hypothetical protein